jgi:hypothetical protein
MRKNFRVLIEDEFGIGGHAPTGNLYGSIPIYKNATRNEFVDYPSTTE